MLEWLGDIAGSIGSGISDIYDYASDGIGDLFSSTPSASDSFSNSPSWSFLNGDDSAIGNWLNSDSVNIGSNLNDSSSLWSSLGNYLSSPSGIGDVIKGGVGIYGMWQAQDRQEKQDKAAKEAQDNALEIQKLKMLYDLEKDKLAMKYRGSGGGGDSFSRQMQMISALNSSANMRISALNNLSSGYANALRR